MVRGAERNARPNAPGAYNCAVATRCLQTDTPDNTTLDLSSRHWASVRSERPFSLDWKTHEGREGNIRCVVRARKAPKLTAVYRGIGKSRQGISAIS